MSKTAFTLAETLITLTIIGVIAAMTIPTMVSKYQKHTYVVGLKKAYSELSQAAKIIEISDCNDFDLKCLIPQLKNSEIIDYNIDGCIPGSYDSPKTLRLADGMLICIGLSDISVYDLVVDVNGQKKPNKYGRDIFRFQLRDQDDSNGKKDFSNFPHLIPIGSKIYTEYVKAYHGVDYSAQYWNADPANPKCSTGGNETDFKYNCTGRVLEEGAMNY